MADESLSDEYSIWAYRLFLDREPESEDTIRRMAGDFQDSESLRKHFLATKEYNSKNLGSDRFNYLGLLDKMRVNTKTSKEVLPELLNHVQNTWEKLGEEEPHWSVLSQHYFKSDVLEQNKEKFEKSAEIDMAILEATLSRNEVDINSLNTCMEFGCGVGRFTRLISRKFEKVDAIDISQSHLRIAQETLSNENIQNTDLHRIRSMEELDRLPKVDFVYTVMVLQHNPPPIMKLLLVSLLNSLNDGGFAFVQIPTFNVQYNYDTNEYMDNLNSEDPFEMHYLPQYEIFQIIRDANCVTVEVVEDYYTGRKEGTLSN